MTSEHYDNGTGPPQFCNCLDYLREQVADLVALPR